MILVGWRRPCARARSLERWPALLCFVRQFSQFALLLAAALHACLQYKQRDELELIFKSWAEDVPFDMSTLRDHRCVVSRAWDEVRWIPRHCRHGRPLTT